MQKLLIKLITYYQKTISPIMGPSKCRFIPSCSQYAIEAISKKGALKGVVAAVWRILRCNPFNKNCGYDPVKDDTVYESSERDLEPLIQRGKK